MDNVRSLTIRPADRAAALRPSSPRTFQNGTAERN
jgi:hypothetical protein